MANYTNSQIIEDGPRNLIIKLTGTLDTADITATDLFDPAALNKIGQIEGLANRFAIKEIKFNIEDQLSVYLWWDATSDVLIVPLEGRGRLYFEVPLTNTEAAGVTGKVQYSTQGWSGGTTLSFALEINLIKYIK